MSESSENLDPKEATEARLCAYLEGEMPDAERAEIEKYLQTNPHHRQLLSDLAKTRGLMGLLPKESAPPEIAGAFEGQLERSMLLDGTGGREIPAGVNRFPQVLLAAAIFLLAIGLGVVVYFTLPGTPAPKFSIAPVPQSTTTPTTTDSVAQKIESTPPVTAPLGTVDGGTGMARRAAEFDAQQKSTLVAAIPPAPTEPMNQEAGDKTQRDAAAPTAKPTNDLGILAAKGMLSLNKTLKDQLAESGIETHGDSLPANTECVVVSTNDPSTTSQTVQTYLAANNILYESRPGIVEKDERHNLTNLSFNAKQPATLPSNEVAANAPAALDQTAPGVAEIPAEQKQAAPGALQANQQPQTANNDVQQPPAANGPAVPLQTIYIARGLNRQQVDLLTAALSAPRQGQTAGIYHAAGNAHFRGDLPPQSTTEPALSSLPMVARETTTEPTTQSAGVIQTNDRLKITVAQLVGPGVDKTNTVRVADDGTISLPMIEPLRAAGVTAPELEKQIAAKYKDANLIPSATVNVDRAATQPAAAIDFAKATTQPAGIAATQPDTQPAGGMPIAANTPVEAKPIDVVIVIQPNTPLVEPASQPAPSK